MRTTEPRGRLVCPGGAPSNYENAVHAHGRYVCPLPLQVKWAWLQEVNAYFTRDLQRWRFWSKPLREIWRRGHLRGEGGTVRVEKGHLRGIGRQRPDRGDQIRGGGLYRLLGDAVGGGPLACRYRQPGPAAAGHEAIPEACRRIPPVWLWPRTLLLGLRGRHSHIRPGRRDILLRGHQQASEPASGHELYGELYRPGLGHGFRSRCVADRLQGVQPRARPRRLHRGRAPVEGSDGIYRPLRRHRGDARAHYCIRRGSRDAPLGHPLGRRDRVPGDWRDPGAHRRRPRLRDQELVDRRRQAGQPWTQSARWRWRRPACWT